jgi:hypothetical protein
MRRVHTVEVDGFKFVRTSGTRHYKAVVVGFAPASRLPYALQWCLSDENATRAVREWQNKGYQEVRVYDPTVTEKGRPAL